MTDFSPETPRTLSRRRVLEAVPATALAAGTVGLADIVRVDAEELKKQGRSMILLWMAGGPSQFETLDPKPGIANGGPTKAISTAVPGVQVAEYWPRVAKTIDRFSLIRSMTNKEGNHQRASYQLHTGYVPSGSVKHPSLSASIAEQLANPDFELPAVVSVGRTTGSGFLGVDYEPFTVNNPGKLPQNVAVPVPARRYRRRLGLLGRLEQEFSGRGGKTVVDNHQKLYKKSSRMVLSQNVSAFDISDESDSLKQKYGETGFGRGCLLARRLVESGVTFVEVVSRGWDTHFDIFERITTKAYHPHLPRNPCCKGTETCRLVPIWLVYRVERPPGIAFQEGLGYSQLPGAGELHRFVRGLVTVFNMTHELLSPGYELP